MRRSIKRGALGGAVLAAALLFQFGSAGQSADAQTENLVVPTGTGEAGYAVNLFPDLVITVETGDTLTFANPWFEPHTVTFPGAAELPPPSDHNAAVPSHPGEVVAFDGEEYVSSGFFFQDESYEISFAEEGTHEFFCIIHPGMQGTVEVVDDADAEGTTQAEVDAAADATFAPAIEALKDAAAAQIAEGVTSAENADGTTTWNVVVGDMVGPSDVQQFFPAALGVEAGDTVVFSSEVTTPHTATFLGGADFPVPPIPENPLVMEATPPPAGGYNGAGYLNSGIIGTGWPAQSYSVTFSEAGSFTYLCVLHVDQGMGGVVNVAATQIAPAPTATATPAAPAPAPTGLGGPGVGQDGSPWMLMGALTALSMAVLAGARYATNGFRR
ncbi:MAG: plastocyanin/azurin family copper-binding protein [Dehalococcoidia bacterium]